MIWRRKERDVSPSYTRLTGEKEFKKVPKGYVPVVVGSDETGQEEERFLVHVKLLKEPCIAALLELAAEKFGYQHGGVLRVPCDAHSFRHTIDLISHCR
ncbi:Auxin-responsive protein SAUR71 [Carex littledalei]|uniref:Auxin-responsive protein SAUR71 n=1 Tax=Carex littledalei TaxID=544730 RepID=A0A833QTK5_9POAL|nr:Auxin-responsive protein SAUR71 [Carex littledalei]